MMRRFLLAKLKDLTVTASSTRYPGSITIDPELLDMVGLLPGEVVRINNQTTGQSWETYILAGRHGSRCCELNGGAAHAGQVGDRLAVLAYIWQHVEPGGQPPTGHVVVFDEHNNALSYLPRQNV